MTSRMGKAVLLAMISLLSSNNVICAEIFSKTNVLLFWSSAKHQTPESADGWQTAWVTGAGTGVGVEAAASWADGSGMNIVSPMVSAFGFRSGFAASKSDCWILNFSAISLTVSPDSMT